MRIERNPGKVIIRRKRNVFSKCRLTKKVPIIKKNVVRQTFMWHAKMFRFSTRA